MNKELLNIKLDGFGEIVAFDISRKYWGYGTNGGTLLNGEGLMCCLGFYSLACGAKEEDMLDNEYPSDAGIVKIWLSQLKDGQFDLSAANDTEFGEYQDREAKEKRIKEIFAFNDIEVNFVD